MSLSTTRCAQHIKLSLMHICNPHNVVSLASLKRRATCGTRCLLLAVLPTHRACSVATSPPRAPSASRSKTQPSDPGADAHERDSRERALHGSFRTAHIQQARIQEPALHTKREQPHTGKPCGARNVPTAPVPAFLSRVLRWHTTHACARTTLRTTRITYEGREMI